MARIEIMSGTERRRRWSDEAKLRILAEAAEPGARIGDVARRNDIHPGHPLVAAIIQLCRSANGVPPGGNHRGSWGKPAVYRSNEAGDRRDLASKRSELEGSG